jgi:hypothetical protein
MTDPNQKQMVSRQEFETHRQQVVHDIEGLAAAIKAESEARSNDTKDIRNDIKALAGSIGNVRTSAGRPQYLALGFSFAIFSTVCAGLAGLYAFMDSQVRDVEFVLANERVIHQVALVRSSEEHFVLGHQEQDGQIVEIRRRLEVLETKP